MQSPDRHAIGFLDMAIDPLRYDFASGDPDEVAGIVASMVPQRSRVLDVGCGTGALTQVVAERCNAVVVGVEPDPVRAAAATRRGIDVHVGMLDRDLAPSLGRFDVVVLADVLEHLADPAALLSQASELLGPGGAIVASVPNVAHWSVRADLLRGRFRYEQYGIMDATHLRWFTFESLQGLFEAVGLHVRAQRVTAGFNLDVYTSRRPMRWMPSRLRGDCIRWGIRTWPNLFGCQHVVRATLS